MTSITSNIAKLSVSQQIEIAKLYESEIVKVKGVKYFVTRVRFPEPNVQGYQFTNVVCEEFQNPSKEVVFSLNYFKENFTYSDI